MYTEVKVFLPQTQLVLFSDYCDENLSAWFPGSLIYADSPNEQYLKDDIYVAKALAIMNIVKGRQAGHRPRFVTKVINFKPKGIPYLLASASYEDVLKMEGEEDYEDISHIHASIMAVQAAYDSLNRHSDHLMAYLTAFSRFSGGINYKDVDDTTAVFIKYKDEISKLRFNALQAFKSHFMLA